MTTLLLKVLVLCLINMSIIEVCAKPTKRSMRRRSSFDNSIFRNRTERCIRLVENMEEAQEMEGLNQEPVDDDFEEVPIKQSEENLEIDVKEKKIVCIRKKESAFRRFIRCLTGRYEDEVDVLSYKKKEEDTDRVREVKETDEAKIKESSATSKTESSGSSSYESSDTSVEPKIVRKNASMTGELTQIGETRLPNSRRLSVSLNEDLDIPGPSNISSGRWDFPTLEERKMIRKNWLECNGDVLHNDGKGEKPKDDKPDKITETRI